MAVSGRDGPEVCEDEPARPEVTEREQARVQAARMLVAAGGSLPIHRHARAEVMIVNRGSLLLYFNAPEMLACFGMSGSTGICIPAGMPHSYRNSNAEVLDILLFYCGAPAVPGYSAVPVSARGVPAREYRTDVDGGNGEQVDGWPVDVQLPSGAGRLPPAAQRFRIPTRCDHDDEHLACSQLWENVLQLVPQVRTPSQIPYM